MERLRNEFKGWRAWEAIWLAANCLIILALSLYWGDSVMGIISAVAGVAYVVCSGKGKLMAYAFGVVNVVLYAIISYKAKFYGEVMLNVLYYLPMQFYGFYVWSRNMDSQTHEVKKRRMTGRGRLLLALVIAAATAAYGFLLRALGGTLPFVDSLSTVVSIFAMIISIRMYMEQWMLWLVVNIVSTAMWAVSFSRGGDSVATLAMWALYIANSVIMHIKWSRESRGAA